MDYLNISIKKYLSEQYFRDTILHDILLKKTSNCTQNIYL